MALPEPSSKEGQNSKQTNDQDDKDFDPTPEALIDEIDDERTLEEEEALNGNNGTAVQEELDDLKKESEMPIEELLAYYERMRNEAQGDSDEEDDDDDDEEEEFDDEYGDDDDDDDNGGDDNDKGGKAGGGGRGTATSSSAVTATATSSGSHGATTSTTSTTINHPPGADTTSRTIKCDKGLKQCYEADAKFMPRLKYLPTCGQMADSEGAHSTSNTTLMTTATTTISPVAVASASPNHSETAQQHPSYRNQVGQQQCCNDSSVNVDDTGVKRKHIMTDFLIDDQDGGMLNSLLGYDLDDSDDMDEDYSYTDDENEDERDWRRVIHVGSEYQADVPEGLSEYDDLPPYENEDKLAWKCNEDITAEQILEFLKQGSMLSKRNDISISPASVPKISRDSLRLYRERMQDITSSTGSHIVDHNHENVITEQNPPTENLTDVYMSQSRKRARIDYELERENAMDAINQACGTHYGLPASSREENSDSTSVDVRPELSTEEYFQDEEQLLFLLLQCNYNFEEALRRRKLDPFKYYLHEPMSLWSQDECLGFEHGLRIYGKNFRSIRENKVQTRTHAEMVAFYYLWKKSERHDVYTNQYKLDRKRCLSHPGTTDYMDKFIEDNESILNASSTPTPTESTVGVNSNVDITNYDNSGTEPLCHSSDIRSPIQYVNNLPQGSIIQRHHLQLQTSPKEDEAEQSNSVFIDSNTPL